MMIDASGVDNECEIQVCELLDRKAEINALKSLSSALKFELPECELAETVIAFDANVLLRMSKHSRCDDIVDYLRAKFPGRIILPGQVIQEFWNNQFLGVESISAALQKKFKELSDTIGGFDDQFGEYATRFKDLMREFDEDYGYIFDDNTARKTKLFVDLLVEKARVPFVTRSLLSALADVRKRTRTPPGFKDGGDGDFFVWADLLLGLAVLKKEGVKYRRVTLVTLDKKIDWSRGGIPHPILTAEVHAISGAEFETITLENLARRLLG
ncbi:PIN-like domain-containing protein [Aquabacter sp. P-9]|uniref:PIN-like domain-containing protein n=1 Tax=Aquabacter sediminis TaxID=3029197 RepID=UPI00237D48B9|nr:PIN-like domain-containing protein [Aquabacter sp. P-9]MDE1569148.1 PIN-like domain-containing protein [Aquabacter sp. P-9]